MQPTEAFFAFASAKPEVGEAVRHASERCKSGGALTIVPWTELDVSGRLLKNEILSRIDASNFFVADISSLNMNVAYEIGYAIGREKPIRLVLHTVYEQEIRQETQKIGLFDTLGYHLYSNGDDLFGYLISTHSQRRTLYLPSELDRKALVYLIDAPSKTDLVVRITQQARLMFVSPRIFDPQEKARLSPQEAIEHVARSRLTIVSLLPAHYPDAVVHNIRAAFVAGVAHGLGRTSIIFQLGPEAPPLDFRDDVTLARQPEHIDAAIHNVAPAIMRVLVRDELPDASPHRTFLEALDIGSSVAEEEEGTINSYYFETDAYRRALRGDARVVLGRKGSGKTALFYRLAHEKKKVRRNVVLDLQPETYKLLKFKEDVLRILQSGSQLHLLTAMWEYILLLETADRLLEMDQNLYHRDHRLFDAYVALRDLYYRKGSYSEADFSERLSVLVEAMREGIQTKYPGDEQAGLKLTDADITEMIYKQPIADLRDTLVTYMREKDELWILVDHLDKGWSATGLEPEDIQIVRGLLEAGNKLQRAMSRRAVPCHVTVCLRKDVFERLEESTPDSGKIGRADVDWTDRDALKQMLAMRFEAAGLEGGLTFDEMWLRISCSEVAGRASVDFVLDRCLMRPRALLGNIISCRNRAVNRGHERIEADDLVDGTSDYARELLREVMDELRTIAPEFEEGIYALIDAPAAFSKKALFGYFRQWSIKQSRWDELIEYMLWYGVLGVEVAGGQARYIYDLKYDAAMLLAIARQRGAGCVYWLNPAIRPALAVSEPQGPAQLHLGLGNLGGFST